MLTIYDTFHLVTCEDGILMVSTKSTDHPFIIINNALLGFLVIHAGEENYNVRYKIKSSKLLEMNKITTYYTEVEDSSHWAVAIPYQGKTVDPNTLYAFSSLSIQKQFSEKDLPDSFNNYNSLAIITGIPE
jgi:hypothetical protein